MSNGSYYSNGKYSWSDQSLWNAAKNCPIKAIHISDLPEASELRVLAEDYRRVTDCDTSFPVVVTPEGHLADGYHRCVKRILQGFDTVHVQQLEAMPPPDRPHKGKWHIDTATNTAISPDEIFRVRLVDGFLEVFRGTECILRLSPHEAI